MVSAAVRYARCRARFAFSSRIEARRNAPRQNRVGARRTAQGRASVTERGVGDGGRILTTLVALAVAAIRCRLKQITEGIALQPLSFYYSLIPIISSPMTAKKIFHVTDVEVLLTGIYTPHVEQNFPCAILWQRAFHVDSASTMSRRDAPIRAKSRNTLLVRVLRVLHAHVRATNVTKISSAVCSVARQSATRTVPRKATSTLSRSRTIFQLKFRRLARVNVRSFLLTASNARARVWLHHKNVHVAPIYLDKNKSEQRTR